MAENTNNSAVTETEETTAAFTTETNSGAGTGTSTIAPGYGTGRRKEAVARVRLVPGTGEWKINGRTLEEYFPSKLLQREVNSPIVLLKLEGSSTQSCSSTVAAPQARPAQSAWAWLVPSTPSTAMPTAQH